MLRYKKNLIVLCMVEKKINKNNNLVNRLSYLAIAADATTRRSIIVKQELKRKCFKNISSLMGLLEIRMFACLDRSSFISIYH